MTMIGPYVNHEAEGMDCSVGHFMDEDDANHFRRLMFADPNYGTVSMLATGRKMTVREYQEAFRCDFVGERPPAHWKGI